MQKTISILMLCLNIGVNQLTAVALQEIEPSAKTLAFEVRPTIETIRLNFFVHGTYCSETTLLNLPNIYFDRDIANSKQEDLVRNVLRKRCKNLYDLSLMYDEGLWLVDPNAPDANSAMQGLALQPIIESFQAANKFVAPETQQVNFLFGWSGFLFAEARRKASVALFNAITLQKKTLVAALQANDRANVKVEVHIYCHSHGGNVAENLAWVDAILRNDVLSIADLYSSFDLSTDIARKNLLSFQKLLDDIPSCAALVEDTNYAMNKWLFRPESTPLNLPVVDHLVLLATPVIVENWPAVFRPFFKQVTSFYSDGDGIQNMDRFSTMRRKSWRNVKPSLVRLGNVEYSNGNNFPRFRQIKIKFADKNATMPQTSLITKIGQNLKINWQNKSMPAFNALSKMVVKQIFVNDELEGPTHGEFWLLSWQGLSSRLPIRPMPLLSFVPMLLDATTNFALKDMLEISVSNNQGSVQFDLCAKKMINDLIVRPIEAQADGNALSFTVPQHLLVKMSHAFHKRKHDLLAGNLVPEKDKVARKINAITHMALNLASS